MSKLRVNHDRTVNYKVVRIYRHVFLTNGSNTFAFRKPHIYTQKAKMKHFRIRRVSVTCKGTARVRVDVADRVRVMIYVSVGLGAIEISSQHKRNFTKECIVLQNNQKCRHMLIYGQTRERKRIMKSLV